MTAPDSFDTARLTTRIAQAAEIDELGHVNNAVYVAWLQDASTAHWFSVVEEPLASAVHWVCLRHEIDYREPVLEGGTVEIRAWLGKASGPRFDRHFDIRKPGAKRFSCQAVTTWLQLNSATGRPKRVSDDVLSLFGLDPAKHR